MYKQCTTEKAALQQRKIEECLLTMMSEKPISEISVSGLCEQTGLSRKTFYRLFESKSDVLCSLIDRTIRDYIHFHPGAERMVPGVPEELVAFYAYWKEQRQILDVLEKNGLSTMLFERCIHHVMKEETGILLQLGLGSAQNQNMETLLFVLSGLLTLVVSWHHTGYQKTPQQMATITYGILEVPPFRRQEK